MVLEPLLEIAPGVERSAEAVNQDDRLARTPISEMDSNAIMNVAVVDGFAWNLSCLTGQ